MPLYAYPLPDCDPLAVFAAVRDRPYSLFFDSADTAHPAGRYSFIAFHPVEVIESKDGVTTVMNREETKTLQGDPFAILAERIEFWGLDTLSRDNLPPFQGGAAGLFGYDLARGIERLPALATPIPGTPDMAVGIYTQVVAFDLVKRQAWHVIHAPDESGARTHQALLDRLRAASPGIPAFCDMDSQWVATDSRASYEDKVRKIVDYIRSGDIFQANLSQCFQAEIPQDFDAFAHYCVLRSVNPAPFASFMNFGNTKIASASPERFLSIRDRAVETCPIKGTRPRDDDPHLDGLHRNTLENSVKDRAENTMIVDLLRNDLSKVCTDHSIEVPDLCRIESFAQVHHFVSTVTGVLRADRGPVDLLRACFPGGSITGCPKIRAMEIIEGLETTRRGPYCGALGYIGFNGEMDSAIAIRTLVYANESVSFRVGGGIVIGSNPSEEYDETLAKAEGIFRSFELRPGMAPRERKVRT